MNFLFSQYDISETWTAIQNFVYGLSGKKTSSLKSLTVFLPCNLEGKQHEMVILPFKHTQIFIFLTLFLLHKFTTSCLKCSRRSYEFFKQIHWKKGYQFSRPQEGCHLPNSSWPEILNPLPSVRRTDWPYTHLIDKCSKKA